MRARLILTVAAAVTMVLLAMLVPLAVLMRDYALEDRLSRAALEVQATETVVASAQDDKGTVSVYLDRINTDSGIDTTVLYPDGDAIGPDPGEDRRVVQARLSGLARLDDVGEGTQLLIPVSLGASSSAPDETPVIRVIVQRPGLDSDLVRAWLILLLLGLALLGGALGLADRIGRSVVLPIRALADHARMLGTRRTESGVTTATVAPEAPAEVHDLAAALNALVGRIETLIERERAQIADLSHRLRTPITALRLRIDALPRAEDRDRVGAELDALQAAVDAVVREARRSEREGLVASCDAPAVLAARAEFWRALADDQARPFDVEPWPAGESAGLVRAAPEDVEAVLDIVLDNVFTHTPDGAAVRISLEPEDGGVLLVVEDEGPGFPSGLDVEARGQSGAGSTGLGLSIVQKTATESGGGLLVTSSASGGGRVEVSLGPA
ncbi:HAMP domain-containing sensor histidine kinase [Nocardioides sp. R-C-SC26]|uniref:sensor histidine kinase n=1 Tax=Nocardioides sp. R-C-SC26 TaxID=2870414 RepID=UPI001E3E57B8|nr:HAMP domain-containing sensor histidine kinase [Nocardioides sp. R-C-SC26]